MHNFDIFLFTRLFESSVAPQILLKREGRRAHEDLAAFLDIAKHTCLGAERSVVRYGQVPCNPDLSGYDAVAAYF